MNAPRITNEERGITINKSLAWSMVAGLVAAGLWFGTETAGTKAAITNLSVTQAQRHSETLQYRREAESRLRALETARATDGSELAALRRDLTAFRADVRELTQLLRNFEDRLP